MQGVNRVLVCELNARRPAFTKVFSINGSRGVTDYFSSRVELPSIVQTVGPDEMDVLHVGVEDPTVIQLHLAQVLPDFLEDAFRLYDTVIIDAPPVIDCPETPPMTSFVDGVVMVVQSGRTRREIVARSLERIEKFKGNVLGIVLNRKKYYIPEFLYKRI
jgi:Mrp family chromosome partitioning ATPase